MSRDLGDSVISLINTIRIGDTADMSRVNNTRYEQDQRAQYIKDTYGIKVPNFYEFNRQFPSDEKPSGVASRIGKWLMLGGIIAAGVLGVGALFVGAKITSIIMPVLLSVGVLGVVGGLVDDEKPQIDLRQMQKYEKYLDSIETDITKAKAQGLIKEVAPEAAVETGKAKSPKSFVELVAESRAAQEQVSGRA